MCRRGKKQQKHFTIFVADMNSEAAQHFVPKLSTESRDWKWVPWADVLAAAAGSSNTALDLHPVVAVLASQHVNEVRSATEACPGPTAAGSGH
jgi:hypothetical protein